MTCKFELISILAVLALLCPISSLQAQSGDLVRTVAFSNTGDAPGTNPPLAIGELLIPVINDLGQTAFFAELNGPAIGGTAGSGESLFTEASPIGLSQVFREDEFVPNSNGSQILTSFPNITNFSNSGQTVQIVGGRINNGVPPSLVLRAGSNSGLEVLVDIDGTVSGLSETSIDIGNISGPNGPNLFLNDRGEVSFSSGGNLFSDTGGQGFRVAASTRQILQASDVPGLSEDVLLATVNSFALNDSSQNLFGSTFSSLESGLLLEDDGAYSLVASTGTDIGPGLRLDGFFAPTLNNRGDTVFTARLEGDGVTFQNDTAIVGNVGGSLEVLAREGDTVSGTDDFTFNNFETSTFGEGVVLGGGGDIAFVANAVGSSSGLFTVDENGTIELIARVGEALPELADGEVISNFSPPSINENGQVAVQVGLSGDGITFDNNRAIFAQDVDGNFQLIAREGDLLNVSDDPNSPDFRLIDNLNFVGGSGDGDGIASGFNNLGEVAFRAEFGRQSGVFVSSLVASVPEPNSVLALFLGASICFSTRRQRRSFT